MSDKDLNRVTESEEVFVNNVNKCLIYLGMTKSDFVSKLKWSPSKFSKSFGTNKGRTITYADACEVAQILGFGIDDLRDESFDPACTRPNNKRMAMKNIKSLSHCLDDAITFRNQWKRLESTFHNDYPRAIRKVLNLFSEEYHIEGHMNQQRMSIIRPEGKSNLELSSYKPFVYVMYKGLDSKTNDNLIFGYWFDESNSRMSLSICYLPDRDKFSNYGIRKRKYYKELVGVQSDVIEESDLVLFADNLTAGEIYSRIYEFDKSDLSNEALERDLKQVFELYKDLLIKSSNAATESFWGAFDNVVSETQDGDVMEAVVDNLTSAFSRRRRFLDTKKKVVEENGYQCEICGRRETFETNDGKQYFEVSHLIPIRMCPPEWNSDVKSNLICVCPQCNRLLGCANNGIREEKIVELYYKHKDALKKDGINVSLSDVLKMNNL